MKWYCVMETRTVVTWRVVTAMSEEEAEELAPTSSAIVKTLHETTQETLGALDLPAVPA